MGFELRLYDPRGEFLTSIQGHIYSIITEGSFQELIDFMEKEKVRHGGNGLILEVPLGYQ